MSKDQITKTALIMRELDDGYYDQKRDHYPRYALTPWEDRERYRLYVERVLIRLEEEKKL